MITKYQFAQIMNLFKDRDEMAQELNAIFNKHHYQLDWANGESYVDDEALQWILTLLEDIFHDEGHWITYWLYELTFGKQYKPGMIRDENGKDIELRSVTDLWNLLMENLDDK